MALANDESASTRADVELARAEAESAREALNHAIKNFKNFEEFKEEILEDGFVSYYVGYEDGRDAIEKLYSDLDLSSIVPPASEDGAAEEEAALTQDEALTAPKVVQIVDTTSEQRDRDDEL